MNINNRYFNPTFIALFILIIWDALKVYLDLSAPIIQLAVLLPVIGIGLIDNFNREFFRTIFSRPTVIWLIWIIYALINTFLITGFYHHRDQNPFVFSFAIIISFLFFLFIINKKTNESELIDILIWAYFIRLLISFIFDTTAIKGYDFVARFGVDFNPNLVGFGALFIIVLLLIKKIYKHNISIIYYLIAALSIYTIIISASKKTFISLIILAIGFLFVSREKMYLKKIVKYSAFSIVTLLSVLWVLNNTTVGLRLIDSYQKTQRARTIEAMFDHRAAQYLIGWDTFKENPINGVGLSNFVNVSGYSTPLHTEYMVQITECGLIGFALFVVFYGIIIKKIILIRRLSSSFKIYAEVHLLSLLIMFVLFSGAWIYSNPMMWVLIALAVRFIKETEDRIINSNVINVSVPN
jgi:O-antigen ligase